MVFKEVKIEYFKSKSLFELIPLQDFRKSWTDEELYKKYKLTKDEIFYIENKTK